MTCRIPLRKTLMTLLTTLFFEPSMACSCAMAPVIERFDEAEYVFSADIIAAEILTSSDGSYDDRIKITLANRHDYKNDSSGLKYLYTNLQDSMCGIAVTIGRNHTFLVNDNGRVSLCGQTISDDERKEFHKLLLNRNLLEKN